MIRTSAPRKSFIYRATLPDCIIPIQYDPDSEKEMKRMRKSRKAWGEFMLASFDKNCTACTGASGRNRRISKMNWIHVTEDQKENIESLFEALRDAIERAEMYEPKQGEERTPMQYSLWMVPDKINTGPLPAIRPFRKRSGRVTK